MAAQASLGQEYQRTVQFQPTQQREQYTPAEAVAPTVLENPAAQGLMAFSKTLADAGKDLIKKKREQRDMEMYNKALNSDNPDEVSQQIQGVKAEMDQDYTASNELARAVAEDGEPEAAVTLRNLSGRDRWYYAKGLAEKVGQRHLGWAQEQLANPERVFAGGPNGTFTASDAARDPILQQVAMKQLRMELLKTHGIENMKPEFFNEWAGQTIRQNEAKLIEQSRTAKINYDGQQAFSVAKSTFEQEILSDPQKALSNLYTNTRAARNAKGSFISPEEYWTAASNIVVELAKAGKIDIAVLEDLKKAPIPGDPKGRVYGDLHSARFTEMANDISQAQRTHANNVRSDNINEVRAAYNRLAAQIRENPELADPRAIQQTRTELSRKYGADVVDQVFSGAEERLAVYSPERAKHLQEVAELEASGQPIFPHDLKGKTDETIRKYARDAQKNLETVAGFAEADKTVRSLATEGVTPVGDEFGFTSNLIKTHLSGRLLEEFEKQMKGGKYTAANAKEAMTLAQAIVSKEINEGRKNPTSKYYQNAAAGGRYENFLRMTAGPTMDQARNINSIIGSRLQAMGQGGLGNRIFDMPDRFFTKSDLEKIQILAQTDPFLNRVSTSDPLFVKVATARTVAAKTNFTLHEIIKRQSKALGMGVVDPQAIFEQRTQLPSKVQGLVDRVVNSTASEQDLAAFNAYQATPGVRGLGQMVRSGEGGYTSMFPSESYPEMTNMTINELVAFQKQKLKDGRKSAAVGAYQFLYPEVAAQRAGLSMNDKFTPENQEKMFMATLMTKPGRESIAKYLRGQSNDVEKAIDELAMEFASIEYRDGRSYYYKDGVNRASVSRARARQALLSARKEMMQGG